MYTELFLRETSRTTWRALYVVGSCYHIHFKQFDWLEELLCKLINHMNSGYDTFSARMQDFALIVTASSAGSEELAPKPFMLSLTKHGSS